MVDIGDIPDFPGLPGQKPTPGQPPSTAPLAVVLVTSPLDRDYRNIALNTAAVDSFISSEISAGRAIQFEVERWSPWSDLQLPLAFAAATQYNYGRFTNGGRSWYAFLDPVYLNHTDTLFSPTPDVWTTYTPDIGYSTVVRGHVGVAAASGGDISYCLEPEDYRPGPLVGYSEYQFDPIGAPRVLVISTTDLTSTGFLTVDQDHADTVSDQITQTLSNGTIDAPQPVGDDQSFSYAIGDNDFGYDDLFYYPYAVAPGLSPGNTMYRPYAFGAIPSVVDGVPAEGGAFLYPSIGAAVTHLTQLAHTPWLSNGIQRVLLVPGGSTSGASASKLTPLEEMPVFTGAPSYESTFSTVLDYDTQLAADWTSGLPVEYASWTKLRTAPYSGIQIGDRAGGVRDHEPQAIVGLGSLTLHVQGVFHPYMDVVTWLTGAEGLSDGNTPTSMPVSADLPVFAVGRDSVLATQAAPIAAERSQSIVDLLTALQRAGVDNSFTLASAFTSTQFAVAEAG